MQSGRPESLSNNANPKNMKRILLTFLLLATLLPAAADEGMWLPSLIASRIDDMRAKGFRLTAEDIY